MKVEIDSGSNITSALERLAQGIGTTVDQVFPWYVEQAVLNGTWTLTALFLSLLFALVCIMTSINKADWSGRTGSFNRYTILNLIGMVALVLTLFVGALSTVPAIKMIKNPNYYALRMLTNDISIMVHGRQERR